MVGTLLLRGMLAGILAGLLAFGFGRIFGEPQIDRAIAFEDHMIQAKGEAPEPEIVSRSVQSGIGLLVGVVVYGTAFGGLFALAFAYAHGRIGNLSPRATSALLAGAAFVVLVIVPDIKYPASPPSVGDPDTIWERTRLFFLLILVSLASLIAAILLGRKLAARIGAWNAGVAGGAVFVALVAAALKLMPAINEVPDAFPATVLWRFRLASFGLEAILWTTIGLVFGVLAEKTIAERTFRPARHQSRL
jgi:hypothetical protein